MADTIREKVLAEIERVFSETEGPEGTKWGRVLDSPFEGREYQSQNVMAVLEGPETYLETLTNDKLDRRIEIELVSATYVPLGTRLRAGANKVLGDIEYIIDANNYWGGHAYGTFFQSNTILREDTNDRRVEVSVFIAVQYRTKRSDPRL